MRIYSLPLVSALVVASAVVIAQPVFAASDFSVESSFTQATLNSAYRAPLRLNRAGNSRWTIVSGSLPTGMTLYKVNQDVNWSDAVLEGTPTQEGTFNFRVMAITPESTYMRDFSLVVFNPRFEVTPLWVVRGRVGIAYLQPLSTNGTVSAPVSWSLSSGSLPAGLALRADTGEIVGTPTAEGTYTFTVSARDSAGRTASRYYSATIEPATSVAPTVVPVEITTRSNPVNGRVGITYPAQIFRARGGSGTYRWNVSGTIPPGLSLDASSGILSGIPTLAGTYSLYVKASDLSNETNNQQVTYTLVVDAAVAPTPSPTPAPTPTPAPIVDPSTLTIRDITVTTPVHVALTARQQALWNTYARRWATVRSNMHTSVRLLSDAMDEAPFSDLTDEVDTIGLAVSVEEMNDDTISYQDYTLAEMQTMIRQANDRMVRVGTLLRDNSRSWTPAQRARANRIRTSLIQTRSSMSVSLQAFTNFRRATPVR